MREKTRELDLETREKRERRRVRDERKDKS